MMHMDLSAVKIGISIGLLRQSLYLMYYRMLASSLGSSFDVLEIVDLVLYIKKR